jgi:hypothetical protein
MKHVNNKEKEEIYNPTVIPDCLYCCIAYIVDFNMGAIQINISIDTYVTIICLDTVFLFTIIGRYLAEKW